MPRATHLISRTTGAGLLLLFVTGMVLTSCNKDDENGNTPGDLLTVEVDTSYHVDGDNWIFVTDLTGDVLDAESYTPGQTVTFNATKDADKINVTIFQGHDAGSLKELAFRTYTNLDRGTKLKLSATVNRSVSTAGEAVIEISGYSADDKLPGSLMFSNVYGWQSSTTNGVSDVSVTLPQSPSTVLIAGYRSGVPVYSWVEGLSLDDTVTRVFTDFDAFPKQIQLNYPGVSNGSITGYYNGSNTPYFMSNTYQLDNTPFKTSTPTLGYLEGFDRYQTYVYSQNDAGSVSYFKTGSVNTSISIPAFTYTVSNNAIKGFAFAFSETYDYYDAQWQYFQDTNWIHWDVLSAPGTFTGVTSIPQEIRSLYPQLDFSKLVYSGCTLTQFKDGRKYVDIVPMSTNESPVNVEYYNFNPAF